MVELKASTGYVSLPVRMQTIAYSMAAESSVGKPCPVVFIHFLDRNQLSDITVGIKDKKRVLTLLNDINSLLESNDLPDPTSVRGRCRKCEFKNYCGDIF